MNLKILKIFLLVFSFALLILISCRKSQNADGEWLARPLCSSPFIPKSYDRQIVGFYTSWREDVLPPDSVRWDKLTRIIYAFARPNADGTINTTDLLSIRKLADSAHANGVEIYVSIGGADGSENFPVMATNEKSRARFINEVRQYVFENCLDGVDIDWEYWTGSLTNTVIPAESNAFVSVLKELKKEFAPFGLGISVDLGASDWWGKDYYDEVAVYADHLMVMGYDFTGTWTAPGQHSSYADAIGSGSSASSTGLAYYAGYRGWPKEKLILGVPFYGKDFDIDGGMYISYSDILLLHPDAYKYDQVDNIYYNGVGTISDKTRYVYDNGFSGIMIWEITQDVRADSVSLLNAVFKIFHP